MIQGSNPDGDNKLISSAQLYSKTKKMH